MHIGADQCCYSPVLLLGASDVNAAPIGGHWGYSNRNPALHHVDLKTLEWVKTSDLTEVAEEPLQTTWRPNLLQKRAGLDRAFLYVRDTPLARLKVHWAEPSILFDHAMILVNLPYSEAGMGFAGSARHDPVIGVVAFVPIFFGQQHNNRSFALRVNHDP